jgi:hypothetical protein
MQINELRKWQKHQPFEPFDILLVDGRRFHVPHPDFLLIPPGPGTWVYVADGSGTADHINTAVISSIRKTQVNGE